MTEKEEISEIVNKHKNCFSTILKSKKYKYLLDFILENTPLLIDSKYNLSTKIYWVLNDLHEFPRCKICGKELRKNVKNFIYGYHEHCSNKCACNDVSVKEKTKETNLKKIWCRKFFAIKRN